MFGGETAFALACTRGGEKETQDNETVNGGHDTLPFVPDGMEQTTSCFGETRVNSDIS